MSPGIQPLLFKHQKQVLADLAVLVPGARDLDAASFFEQFDEPGTGGFKDRGCSGAVIALPRPKEAAHPAHLHVEEHYETSAPHDLKFYRYEICWAFDVALEAQPNDYLRESMLVLRRGVRFDHHPHVQDAHHPTYHWHPNGCSEFRLQTGKITALKAAALAFLMFDRKHLERSARESQQLADVVLELRREMPSLP